MDILDYADYSLVSGALCPLPGRAFLSSDKDVNGNHALHLLNSRMLFSRYGGI